VLAAAAIITNAINSEMIVKTMLNLPAHPPSGTLGRMICRCVLGAYRVSTDYLPFQFNPI
jgi:hypothetical protein